MNGPRMLSAVVQATVLFSLCLAGAGCGSAPDLKTAELFQNAETAFREAQSEEDFIRVATRYDQILSSGFVSGAVLYNQGNAWMRAGQPGRAIACWRAAQRYRPRDPYLTANLQSALSSCGSAAMIQPDTGMAGYVLFWQNWLSETEKFLLTTVLLAAVCLCSTFAPWVLRRRLANRLTLALTAGFLLSAASAAWDWHRFDRINHGVVAVESAMVRKGNSESYESAFTKPVTEGTEFRVLDRRSDWLQVEFSGIGTGWLPSWSVVTY